MTEEQPPEATDPPQPTQPEADLDSRRAASLAAASGSTPPHKRPSYLLLALVSGLSLGADLGTKWWALHALEKKLPSGDAYPASKDITSYLSLVLARNRGGAWGLLQTADEHVRRPFFLLISLLAIAFIVSLYRRVHPQQHALKWGLPLVLGGALGNLIDRIRYSWVIDFIDYRATWVRHVNEVISKIWSSHAVTDHWPTFNAADIAICVGVGLMAIDMFTSRRIPSRRSRSLVPEPPVEPSSQPSAPPTVGPPV
jgi:signal peptidase II